MSFDTIPDILDDIRAGRMVVMLDDEDRENEGDLIMAAGKVRPKDINFMVREARGLVCLALTEQRCRQLGLGPMVSDNTSPYRTNFTVSIEAAEGVTTGISAHDRARTVQAAMRADARPGDLVRPGHIFPLAAQPGGVLGRAGHTEAATDLAGLAGLEPAGVLVEILHDDGSMARRPQLEAFARKHGLRIGTIADLIRHRLRTERIVDRVHDSEVDTEAGPFRLVVFRDRLRHALHFALLRGDVASGTPAPACLHVHDTLSDVLRLKRDGCGSVVASALQRIAAEDRGVLVVLSGEETGESVLAGLAGRAPDGVDDDRHGWRRLGLGAQILADLGVRRLRVSGSPCYLAGLAAFGLDVVDHDALG